MGPSTTEKLMHELRSVVDNAEELLKETTGQTGERIDKVRRHAEQSLASARAQLRDVRRVAEERAREAARGLDEQVHEQPWAAVTAAALIGLVAGFLLDRR